MAEPHTGHKPGKVTKGQERIAFLTNFVPPYRKPVLLALAKRCRALRILISTPMEANRQWAADWTRLDVVVQKTFTFTQRWRHPQGSDDRLFVHLPLDTIGRLRRFRPDVVISGEMGFRTLLAAVYRKLWRSSKLIIWADISESSEAGRGRMRRTLRFALGRAGDAYIVNGRSGARYLRTVGVPPTRIHQVPYATDLDRFWSSRPNRDPAAARRLLYVGQLLERKGLLPFIKGLTRWAEGHPETLVHFQVVGDGPLRKQLQSCTTPPNLTITFPGNIAYRDLPRIYEEAGIFVFPTLADTWGLVVNEAMAAGLPVLGSLHGPAVEELVEEGKTGWLFRADDPASVDDAIERCMTTSDDVLAAMRHQAQEAARRLSPEYVAGRIMHAVSQCLAPVNPSAFDTHNEQEKVAWS